MNSLYFWVVVLAIFMLAIAYGFARATKEKNLSKKEKEEIKEMLKLFSSTFNDLCKLPSSLETRNRITVTYNSFKEFFYEFVKGTCILKYAYREEEVRELNTKMIYLSTKLEYWTAQYLSKLEAPEIDKTIPLFKNSYEAQALIGRVIRNKNNTGIAATYSTIVAVSPKGVSIVSNEFVELIKYKELTTYFIFA